MRPCVFAFSFQLDYMILSQQVKNYCIIIIIIIINILVIIYMQGIYLNQTMFILYRMLQLFYIYNLYYTQCYFACKICLVPVNQCFTQYVCSAQYD